jgi:hypothetical protein
MQPAQGRTTYPFGVDRDLIMLERALEEEIFHARQAMRG